MKVNPADKPKVIALVGAIVVIGGFGVFNLVSKKGPDVKPAGQTADPNANLPTATMLAEGKYRNDAPGLGNPDLASMFPGGSPMAGEINPFRSPVPPVKEDVNAGGTAAPTGGAMPPRQIGGDGFAPVNLNQASGSTAPTIRASQPMLVKGIISPEGEAASGMAFIKVGEITKGFRVGDTVSPGIKLVDIRNGMVIVRLGDREVKAPVGRELKFF